MARDPFEEFVDRQVREAEEASAALDPDREIAEWRGFLEALYAKCAEYLQPFVNARKIELKFRAVTIEEELLGSYEVRALDISIGASRVRFEPVGTYLIGAKGRVDVQGPRGTARLVLVDRNADRPRVRVTIRPSGTKPEAPSTRETPPDWSWKIATDGSPIRYLELTADSLHSMLMSVVGG